MKKSIPLFLLCAITPMKGMSSMQENYKIETLTGQEIERVLPFIAVEGPKGYRSYPYLYESDEKNVLEYLKWLATLPQTAVAIAYHDNAPVGFAMGTALTDYAQSMFPQNYEETMNAFKRQSRDPNKYYYITAVITLSEHESESLNRKLYAPLEAYGRMNGFEFICFAALSFDTHLFKPDDYQEPDGLWERQGYIKSNLTVRFSWKTLQPTGPAIDQVHELAYWIKQLK